MDPQITIRVGIQNHHKYEIFKINHAKPIPRIGECLKMKGEKYRIIDVTHNYGSAYPENLLEPAIELDAVIIADEITREIEEL